MTTIAKTADHATEQVKEAARATFLDLSTQVMKLINGAREAEGRGVEAVLDRLGLQRRQSALMPVLWITVGAVAAGTTALLLAPSAGKNLRQRIAKFLSEEVDTLTTQAKASVERVAEVTRQQDSVQASRPNGAERHS